MENRAVYQTVKDRLAEPRKFSMVLSGPRQVGKMTIALKVSEEWGPAAHYVSADSVSVDERYWLKAQWEVARQLSRSQPALLILDEVQKIHQWSSIVKELWDEDSRNQTPLKVMMLGSSPWLIQQGLTESLAGRFETIAATHWTYPEMKKSFGWTLEEFIYYGGYPGSADLIREPTSQRWASYINDSLIESIISRDILSMTQINKPALLRRLFQLACHYSSQLLSFQKMLGQLHDSGNTTTLAHYLKLLDQCSMVTGIQKFAGGEIRKRGSSPKLQVYNTALMSAQSQFAFVQAQQNKEHWGRVVESAVGAYLLNGVINTGINLYYWRDGDREVDFVLQRGERLTAIEVRSGQRKESLSGMDAFDRTFTPTRILIVGEKGISFEDFLSNPVSHWL